MTLCEVRALAHAVLTRFGLTEAHVAAVAETMVAGERDGCASHGIYRLLVCAHTIRSGKVVLDAEPRIAASAPGLVRVDAGGGFAQLAFRSEEHTSELQSLMRISYAVFCLKKKKQAIS